MIRSTAAALASRALALNQFDDGAHELLVRCLARAGEVGAAREQADACDVLFRRELGRAPDPGVRRPPTSMARTAHRPSAIARRPSASSRRGVRPSMPARSSPGSRA